MILFMLYNDRYSPYYDKTLQDDQKMSGKNSREPVFVGGGGDRMSRTSRCRRACSCLAFAPYFRGEGRLAYAALRICST